MRGNERKNLTLRRRTLRLAKALRMLILLLPMAWMAFFFFLRFIHVDLPRIVDIIILGSVIFTCTVLGIIDVVHSRKKCRCPFCGRPWSMIKYSEFRRGPFDLINNTDEYICYNCKEEIDIL